MSRPCTICGGSDHTQFYCRRKPRTPIKVNKPPNRIGRQGKRTQAAVSKWKRQQPPNHQGYWQCYICGRSIPYLIAEHVKSKARHPDQRENPNNLKPTCNACNAEKGSKDN